MIDKKNFIQLTIRWSIVLALFLGLPTLLSWLLRGTSTATFLINSLWVFGFAAGLAGLKWERILNTLTKSAPEPVQNNVPDVTKFALREKPRVIANHRSRLSQTVKLILEPVGACVEKHIYPTHYNRSAFNRTVRLILSE